MTEIKTTKEIQQVALDVLVYIDKVCTENNIEYSLSYGTALGAIRHKGFIPWDDDVDIMMTRENYNKFLEVMDKLKNSRYKCLYFDKKNPNYFYNFAKVVDLTTFVEEINFPRNENMGVYVDIFPIDGIPEKNAEKIMKKYHKLIVLHYYAASKKFVGSKRGFIYSFFKFFKWIFAKIIGWKNLCKICEKFLKKYPVNSCKFAGIYDDSETKNMFEKEFFENLILVDFENYKFPIVKDYDRYLTKIYGDYMTPPPENEREQHHIIAFKKD